MRELRKNGQAEGTEVFIEGEARRMIEQRGNHNERNSRTREGHRVAHRTAFTQGGALMAQGSGIEWTESTWNPVTLKWKKPQTIFVNSMSDLFHEDVPIEYIQKVFDVMNHADWHRFQVLTKRADRLEEMSSLLNWTSNIWMGVSVENDDHRQRIDYLRRTGAHIKFLSLEPLLGPLPELDMIGINWVIVGGESGPKSRPMRPEWVIDLRDQCRQAEVPFFFKQWGGKNKKQAGRMLEKRVWNEMPRDFNRTAHTLITVESL